MDLDIIKGQDVKGLVENLSKKIIEELKNHMDNTKLTDDSKVEFQNERNNIIKSFGEIYEVKDGGVYIYKQDKKFPEFNRELYNGQKSGFYINENNNLIYDDKLNYEINSKINKLKNGIIEKQNKILEDFRKIGEEYRVEELGDDEKLAYITRVSDGKELQDFNLSDEIYDKIKQNNKKHIDTTLIWNGKEYEIK
jgi:hypothetical protein